MFKKRAQSEHTRNEDDLDMTEAEIRVHKLQAKTPTGASRYQKLGLRKRRLPSGACLSQHLSFGLLTSSEKINCCHLRILVCGTLLLWPCILIQSNSYYYYCMYAQPCPTFCKSMDCSPLGSSVHGMLQARILKWVAVPFSRGSSPPRE